MTPRERAEELWETWKKATFVVSTQTIHAQNYITLAEQAITAAIEEEREACAKIADDVRKEWNDSGDYGAAYGSIASGTIGDRIRARSEPSPTRHGKPHRPD